MQHFFIVGGGLAGIFMAARLCEAGQRVSLADVPMEGNASHVAAGLFNVITGRFGAKSWKADTLLQEIQNFHQQPAFQSLQAYYHYLPIYRPFKQIANYNKWTSRKENPRFAHLVKFHETPLLPDRLNNELGGIEILPCGWVDIPKLIQAMRELLLAKYPFQFIPQKIEYEQIHLDQKQLQMDGKTHAFDHIIFAEGFRNTQNPFIKLPIQPNKGETLLLHAPKLQINFALSRRVYLIPIGNDQYVTGSTYRNEFDHLQPTDEGKTEIIEHLKAAIHVPFDILNHKAGIRPTTPDRRPIVGTHPELNFVHVLTGFGTKGVLLSPYCSQQLTQHILHQQPLDEEINLRRFL